MMHPQYLIIEPAFDCPFRIEVLRIVPLQSYDDGLTLFFLHATNLHKESLIPLIKELLATISPVKIKDVWVMDNPNHGRSASLNRALLETDEYRERWSVMDNMRALHAVLSTTTHRVDFSRRKLVVISQSGASSTVVMLQKKHPEIILRGQLLLDPAIAPPNGPSADRLTAHYTKMAKLRGDRWANIDEARQELLTKGGFRYFAPEVFELFLKCALRPIDDSSAVTLATTKAHDIAYSSSSGKEFPFAEALLTLCKEDKVPIHLVVCLKDELRGLSDEPKAWQTEIISKTSNGSVQHIEKGGHLFPQVEPILAARHVRNALMKIWGWHGVRL